MKKMALKMNGNLLSWKIYSITNNFSYSHPITHSASLLAITTRPQPMNSTTALDLLKQHKAELSARFDVKELALFGSTSRDTATSDSDIDILVEFDGPATSQRYHGVQFFLEDMFGQSVDLVTTKALRAELWPFIETDALRV